MSFTLGRHLMYDVFRGEINRHKTVRFTSKINVLSQNDRFYLDESQFKNFKFTYLLFNILSNNFFVSKILVESILFES